MWAKFWATFASKSETLGELERKILVNDENVEIFLTIGTQLLEMSCLLALPGFNNSEFEVNLTVLPSQVRRSHPDRQRRSSIRWNDSSVEVQPVHPGHRRRQGHSCSCRLPSSRIPTKVQTRPKVRRNTVDYFLKSNYYPQNISWKLQYCWSLPEFQRVEAFEDETEAPGGDS